MPNLRCVVVAINDCVQHFVEHLVVQLTLVVGDVLQTLLLHAGPRFYDALNKSRPDRYGCAGQRADLACRNNAAFAMRITIHSSTGGTIIMVMEQPRFHIIVKAPQKI